MTNRVWIELERPEDDAEGTLRAALASRMLKRLGSDYPEPVFWNERAQRYCVTIDGGGVYQECTDNGHWFSLDYFGREDSEQEKIALGLIRNNGDDWSKQIADQTLNAATK